MKKCQAILNVFSFKQYVETPTREPFNSTSLPRDCVIIVVIRVN